MSTFTINSSGQIDPGLCPNCLTHSNFQTYRHSALWPRALPDATPTPAHIALGGDLWLQQIVVACWYCSKTVILNRMIRQTESGWQPVGQLRQVWPAQEPRELDPSAPAKARDLFAEGARAEAAEAYRAAAAMYRAAVEELCKDRGAEGNNLFKKIEDLVNRGVTREIVDDLHEARFLGNWSLHDGLEFSAQEVADVAELIAEAVHILYVQPEERRRMRDARKARRDAFTASNP